MNLAMGPGNSPNGYRNAEMDGQQRTCEQTEQADKTSPVTPRASPREALLPESRHLHTSLTTRDTQMRKGEVG